MKGAVTKVIWMTGVCIELHLNIIFELKTIIIMKILEKIIFNICLIYEKHK